MNHSNGEEATPTSKVEDREFKNVYSFKYLGNILPSSCDFENKVHNRIRLGSVSLGRLKDRFFLIRDMNTGTKVIVCRAVYLSVLLYGSETWILYSARG